MTTILDLPVELLQSIADYRPDLTILRLVCRAFNDAFHVHFGRQYLKELHCFVLDPRRLLRLKCITSQMHLVSKIQRVCFSFDALEGKVIPDIPTVHDERWRDYFDFEEVLQKQACKSYRHRLPNLAILESILEDLRIARRASLAIDFTGYSSISNERNLILLSEVEVARVFEKILLSGCTLSRVKLRCLGFLEAALRGRTPSTQEQFLQASRSLERLEVDNACSDLRGETLLSMMRAESALQDLFAKGHVPSPYLGKDERWHQSLAFANGLISANAYPVLQTLSLHFVPTDPSYLSRALQSWNTTLRSISFWGVHLPSPGDHWLAILKLLRSSFAHLEFLQLSHLTEESRDFPLPDGNINSGRVLFLDIDEESGDDLLSRVTAKQRGPIQDLLLKNIESGLTESYEIKLQH